MRKINVFFCILFFTLLFTFGCKKQQVNTNVTTQVKTGGNVKIIMPWGQLSFSLNPFMSPGNRLAIVAEIYEPLIYIFPTDNKETFLLATSYQWTNNDLDLIFNLRKGVEWSDGHPFTSKDVVFTFNCLKTNKDLDQFGLWDPVNGLKSVEARDKYTVVFKFSFVNTPHMKKLNEILIVPEHIWAKIENPSKETNENPIGTGAFLFKSFSSENNIIYGVRNPKYWDAGKPGIDSFEIHSVKDNNLCLLSMLKDEADWTYTQVQDVKKAWVDKDPQNHIYWFPKVNTVNWHINTEKAPFNNPKFRKAIAMVLDKELMSDNVYHGIGAAHPTGLLENIVKDWMPEELKGLVYDYDVEKAKKALAEIGYQKKGEKLYGPDGKELRNIRILVGAGWTDYIGIAQIIVDNLKELGISASIDQQQWGTYYPSFQTGTYDTGVIWGEGIGPDPYYFYVRKFSEIKEIGNLNFSRYTNPEITKALKIYQQTSDVKIQKAAMAKVIKIVLEDVPYIPLTYAISHNIYNQKRFVSWPSDSNPYADGAPDTPAGAIILKNLHLK